MGSAIFLPNFWQVEAVYDVGFILTLCMFAVVCKNRKCGILWCWVQVVGLFLMLFAMILEASGF